MGEKVGREASCMCIEHCNYRSIITLSETVLKDCEGESLCAMSSLASLSSPVSLTHMFIGCKRPEQGELRQMYLFLVFATPSLLSLPFHWPNLLHFI